jgi:DNA-binding NtrC family response regulator
MSRRVLVVDDDEMVRSVFVEELIDAGYDVIDACDADDALIKLRQQGDVSIVLTDVRMPGAKDGVDLAQVVRSLDDMMPIIIMTGYAEDLGQRMKAIDPPVRLLQKPCRSAHLRNAVQELLQESGNSTPQR